MTGPDENNGVVPKDMELPVRSWKQRLLAVCIIVLILCIGAAVVAYMMKTKPQAKRKPPVKMKILATAMTARPTSLNVEIEALGKVVAAQEIKLQARVAGHVVHLHPDFAPGGIIKKDEVILRLDDTDYRLNLQQKQNTLAQARADLRIEEGNQRVASQEWELINGFTDDIDASSKDLALRKPQLDKARAAITVAETEVERAETDLGRTVIRSPFNAIVSEKNVDMGSQVSSASVIASLTGIDSFWMEISVPVDKLDWITLPGAKAKSSTVAVYAADKTPHTGEIVSLLPRIDEDGLMARLLLTVPDPLGLGSGRSPLLLGSFVRATITGKRIEDVFKVPRSALKDGNKLLLVTPENTLHVQEVEVRWRNADAVWIGAGLSDGDKVIVSNIGAPVEGMTIDLTDSRQDKSQASGEGQGNGRKQQLQ